MGNFFTNLTANPAKLMWSLLVGGLIYAAVASRSKRGFAPLAFAGVGAYMVCKAMDNQRDYLSVGLFGSSDLVPF